MKRVPVTRIVLVMLCLMYFITYLDRTNVSTAASGFRQAFGLNNTQIGLVFSAFAYPYLIIQIIGGWISDRFGARGTLIVCGIVWATATALTGMAGGLTSMLVARVLLGFGEGATFPAATAAMGRWVPNGERGRAQGITHAAARIGNALAPAAVTAIMAAWGWRASFFVCAAISFAWVAIWAMTFTEFPKNHPRISAAELAALTVSPVTAPSIPWGPLIRRMAPVTMVYFCYGWTLWLFLSWVPQYFLESQKLDLKHSAWFASCVFFAGVLGDSLGGIVTDRIVKKTGNLRLARSTLVAVCLLLSTISLVPLMFSHGAGASLVFLSAGFFFSEMTIGAMWATPMDIAPLYCGTASGIMNTGSAMAAIISPVVGGILIDLTGNYQLPFVGSMVLMGIGVLLAARMRPDLKFEAQTAPHP